MPAAVSGEESASVMNIIQHILNFFGFSAELTDFIVRKIAHFTEYTALGCLLLSCAYSFDRIKPQKYFSYYLLVGLFVPVCDEFIQLFVDGRSAQVTDVLIDFSGVILGTVIMLVVYSIYRRVKKIN